MKRDTKRPGLRNLWADQRGSVAVYASVAVVSVLAMAALAVDYGGATVLKAQMQNAADAAALAAAAELNGAANARTNAHTAAAAVAARQSTLVSGAFALADVNGIEFFEDQALTIPATTDAAAVYVRVNLAPRQREAPLTGFIDILAGTTTDSSITVSATATAGYAAIICEVTPLFVCEPSDASRDLFDDVNIGRQVIAKYDASNAMAGNFGLLRTGSNTSQTMDHLGQDGNSHCVQAELDTLTGNHAGPTADAVNSRFTGPDSARPAAPNVITYFQDDSFAEGLGSGNWRPDDYWSTFHTGPRPATLQTRYQIYLWELGKTFWVNGKETRYPVSGALPAGWTEVVSPGTSIPANASSTEIRVDGVPDSAYIADDPEDGPNRRVLEAAVLDCSGLHGRTTGIVPKGYVRFFLTQDVLKNSGSGRPLYNPYYSTTDEKHMVMGELLGSLTRQSAPQKFHLNVQLVR